MLVRYEIIFIALLIIDAELCQVTAAGPNKIKIDSSTRLYVEEKTGRYRMFHGLALENSGSPWYYATYTSEQIKLLKQVTIVTIFSGTCLLGHLRSLSYNWTRSSGHFLLVPNYRFYYITKLYFMFSDSRSVPIIYHQEIIKAKFRDRISKSLIHKTFAVHTMQVCLSTLFSHHVIRFITPFIFLTVGSECCS